MSDSRTSQIQLNVTTDANKVPTAIRWSASDAGIADAEAKAFALSVWNGREALSIDLWDKDMTVEEMKVLRLSIHDDDGRCPRTVHAGRAGRRRHPRLHLRAGRAPGRGARSRLITPPLRVACGKWGWSAR